MWYYLTLTRNGKKLYLLSPRYGQFALSEQHVRNVYLFSSEASAVAALDQSGLREDGDVITVVRTYKS